MAKDLFDITVKDGDTIITRQVTDDLALAAATLTRNLKAMTDSQAGVFIALILSGGREAIAILPNDLVLTFVRSSGRS